MRRTVLLLAFAVLGLALAASSASSQVTPTITGTTDVYLCGYNDEYASWSVSISGGIAPYTIRWGMNLLNSTGPGGTTTFGGFYFASNIDHTWTDVLYVHVTDWIGQTGTSSISIYCQSIYSSCAQFPPDPWEPCRASC